MNIFDKWKDEYINGVSLEKIEWLKLGPSELEKFFRENYFDNETLQYVVDEQSDHLNFLPLGLTYLSFDCPTNGATYLLGVVPNNKGTKTIVSAMIYIENFFFVKGQTKPITYITTIETNTYFQRMGINNRLLNNLLLFINPNNGVLVSKESQMGSESNIVRRLKESLCNQGFIGMVWVDDYSNKTYDEISLILKNK